MAEQQKRRAPGINEHLRHIASIKDELTKIEESISTYNQRIQDEIYRQKEKSGKVQLFATKDQINNEIKELFDEKNAMNARKNRIIEELTALKGDTKRSTAKVYNLSEIEKKEREIEERMISEKYNSRQEKEFQAVLLDLKKKKSFCGEYQEKEIKVDSLERELQDVKEKIRDVNETIDSRKSEMADLKVEIERIREEGKSKNDVIIDCEDKIQELKKKRKDLLDRKRSELLEVQKKEEEYQKIQAELAAQIEIENKKKEKQKKIKQLGEELNKLEEEKNNFDPNKYDGIIDAVKRLKNLSSLPLSLVNKLSEERINIPQKEADIQNVIQALEMKKSNFGKEMENKLGSIGNKMKRIQETIGEEQKILESMPATEIRISNFKRN